MTYKIAMFYVYALCKEIVEARINFTANDCNSVLYMARVTMPPVKNPFLNESLMEAERIDV